MHVAVHVALMFLVVWDLSYTPLILGIALLHLIIDALKLILHRKKTKRLFFFIDQLLHLITIIGLTAMLYADAIDMTLILDTKLLTLLICVAFLTKPTSIIMKVIFSKWNISKLTKDNESLKDAGNYIGVLERLLVFIFIITNHWEAVGFLITAKSVFRFGDLTASKERKLTEYILIGTLISFGIAILTSLLYLNLINYV